jgi:hypothetical protein
MSVISDAVAALDEAREQFEEAGGHDDGNVRDYEHYEDSRLDFADTAESWVRAALEALEPAQIEKVDRRMALNFERAMSQGGTE